MLVIVLQRSPKSAPLRADVEPNLQRAHKRRKAKGKRDADLLKAACLSIPQGAFTPRKTDHCNPRLGLRRKQSRAGLDVPRMERFSCCKTARRGQGLLWMAQKKPLKSRIFSWLAMSNWLPSPLGVFPTRAGSRSFPLASSLIHCTLRRSALIYVGCVHSKAPGNVQLQLPYHQDQRRSEHSEWCQNCYSYFLNYFYEK